VSKIKLIKTLPHLHTLFLPHSSEDCACLSNFSLEGFNWIRSLRKVTNKINFGVLLDHLIQFGFRKVDRVSSPSEFSQKGDIVSLWPVGYDHPIKISFFGDEIDELYFYDEVYGRKINDIQEFFLGSISKGLTFEDCKVLCNVQSKLPEDRSEIKKVDNCITKIIFTKSFQGIFSLLGIPAAEVISANEKGFLGKYNEFFELGSFEFLSTDFVFPQLFFGQEDIFINEIKRLVNLGYEVFISEDISYGQNIESKLRELIQRCEIKGTDLKKTLNSKTGIFLNIPSKLPAGFISESLKLAYFTDRELNGTIYLGRSENFTKAAGNIKKLLRQLEGNVKLGDYVVHEDYGIAIYKGLSQDNIDGEILEFIELEFERSDKLFVPLNQTEKISKYIAPEGSNVKLSKLGGNAWQNTKKKVASSTGALAKKLLKHYATLATTTIEPIDVDDTEEYKQFISEFPYELTPDQINSINEIFSDLAKNKPMNRLLVGDVGFGKTEVIMRACFKVVEKGGQAIVLSPTTVLTQQHFEVFKKRFQNFPISIGFVSRFKTAKQNQKEIESFNSGMTDILIGTHRLISNDLKPKRLKLIVIDEEQKFGVKQKEKLKELNYSAHLLSVSATPIPRTLGMALSSLKDLSIISTPPANRKPIKTEIIKDNWNKVIEAIKYEVDRGGQVFFLHNEISTLQIIYDKLAKLLPDYRFVIAHGRMSNDELDRFFAEFYDKRYDVLITTTIIENGLDMPNVNTIIINNANLFGIAQLYQLRGRVGRSDRQAFCYLMYKGFDIDDKSKLLKNFSINKHKRTNHQSSNKSLQTATSNLVFEYMEEKAYLKRLKAIVENQDLGAGFRLASRDLEIRGAGNLLGEEQSGFISNVGYVLYLKLLAQEIERLKQNN